MKIKKFEINMKSFSLLSSLKAKLIISFVIPLFFVILVGVYSYQKASLGMLNNYENSTMQMIQMTTQYMDFGFQSIEADALQIYNDETVIYYALNQYKNDAVELKRATDYLKQMMMMKEVSNQFIENIHIITSSDVTCVTTASIKENGKTNGFYKELLEEHNNALTSKASREKWEGFHTMLDENFALDKNQYICSQYRILSSGNAAVVIDVSSEQIESILNSMELGESSVVAFITADGREKVISSEEFSFLDQSYYNNAIQKGEDSGSEYIKMNGKEYLFMFSKCDINNAVVCALVPKSFLMKEAEDLKGTSVLLILLSCVIVFVMGLFIMLNISRNMSSLTKRLSNVAEGDLTIDMNIRSKSEFGVLAGYIKNTIENTKKLILQTLHISFNVTESVDEVTTATDSLKKSTSGIEQSIEEINQGVNQQAQDAEQCLTKMDNLSALIEETGGRVTQMQEIVEKTTNRVLNGNKQMLQLKEKEAETSSITIKVADWIEELLAKSQEIERFVESINDISEETTLLSLNASIEAARAGDAGRGFAVVAEQIKKLAENSLNSSKEIEKVVKEIVDLMQSTMNSSRKAREVVDDQDIIVSQTEKIFLEIQEYMENIQINVVDVNSSMQKMMKEREDTLGAVESISGVLEQTAASSSYVKEMAISQLEQVKFVENHVKELDEKTKQLINTIRLFKVE